MALPVNINELINGQVVEWARLEFKEGWNPQDVMHSICAFANDIDNWGGGYIIIGVDCKDGNPVMPPKGLQANQLDKIQRELLGLSHKISPAYFPVVVPEIYQGKHILIVWVPGGETRPYNAPISLAKEEKQRGYYIRRYSSTVRAKQADEIKLIGLAAKVPHDDRINHQAKISDLDLGLIQGFLQETGSNLYEQSKKLSFNDLCRQMQIARGSKEFFKPVNAGLLFFCEHPERFFSGARIEVVIYHDGTGDKMTEKIFTGPLQIQLRNTLEFINAHVIVEHVMKVPRQAKAIRFYDYPYEAVKEALANAVYHRSYEDSSIIEVSVRNHEMRILSVPGPLPPIGNKELAKENVPARMYRNRRIGDFLKELHLTEGRSTGFPKIRRAMKVNGSPKPIFKTDKLRTSFLAILPERQLTAAEGKVIADVNFKLTNRDNLNRRQLKAVEYAKKNGSITNTEYRGLFSISRALAKRDLADLSAKKIIVKTGEGRASAYELLITETVKYPTKPVLAIPKNLDKKISRLERELEAIHPDKTIQEFSQERFFDIYNSWLSELMRKVIPIAQRFNKFFLEVGHFASVISGIGFIKFTNEDAEEIIGRLKRECQKNRENIVNRKTEFQLSFNFSKLIKGGTKAFSIQYNMGVEFNDLTYNVFMDEYPNENRHSHKKQFDDRLFREPVTEKELDGLTNNMGEIILGQIEYLKKKNGIK